MAHPVAGRNRLRTLRRVVQARALPPNGTIVFVGDGYSDRCAALAADRVFARDSLAVYLDEREIAYEPFEDFGRLGAALRR
jgi:2-hydroxy-3-keto-5-methylthiopentenyl-1-phosphate phosphatase